MKKKSDDQRKKEAQPLKDAIEDMLKAYRLKDRYDATHLISAWPKMMGPVIANRTEKLYLKEKTLFIKVTSGPLKNELMLSKDKILAIIHEKFPESLVNEVKVY